MTCVPQQLRRLNKPQTRSPTQKRRMFSSMFLLPLSHRPLVALRQLRRTVRIRLRRPRLVQVLLRGGDCARVDGRVGGSHLIRLQHQLLHSHVGIDL